MRWLVFALSMIGCIPSQLTGGSGAGSDPDQVGTQTCGQIVETCTSTCSDPLCVKQCQSGGNARGQAVYGTLLTCAQDNRCMDEACIDASCAAEVEACKADGVLAPTGVPAVDPASQATDPAPAVTPDAAP